MRAELTKIWLNLSGRSTVSATNGTDKGYTSDVDFICVRKETLRIEEDHITFPEDHISIGDQYFLPAFHQDDDGLPGDIQIPYMASYPGIALLEDDFLQADVFLSAKTLRQVP